LFSLCDLQSQWTIKGHETWSPNINSHFETRKQICS
jgi:hypothetical protein